MNSEPDVADSIAVAVLAVPGVSGLHPGMFGEVGTYLPGHRVVGVRVGDAGTDIHVTVTTEASIDDTAARIRAAVAHLVTGTVNVTVEDIVEH
ncbi:putative alkaline shock family protein YloU [Rhodococcus sp. 27YEA15]|uniref:hypothetical protein n=1 Tax=Rhodococcus sp. 27YEA15 TaxID=3156259 RepID=UPI003C7A15B4